MKKKLPNKYKLNGGFFYNDDSLQVLKSKGFVKKYQNKIDLVFTPREKVEHSTPSIWRYFPLKDVFIGEGKTLFLNDFI